MMTLGTQIQAFFRLTEEKLRTLGNGSYSPEDIRDVMAALGARTELFLKAILRSADSRRKFFDLVRDLPGQGVTADSMNKLDAVRLMYNDGKHQTVADLSLIRALGTVRDGSIALEEIVAKSVGASAALVRPFTPRVFWINVYDHFAQGDSTVMITLPQESNHWLGPPSFDQVQIEMAAWDNIKADLSRLGKFSPGKGLVPKKLLEGWAKSDSEEYLGTWVFEGDYRALLMTLAKHELVLDLLPGLNRRDQPLSIVISSLLACIDVVASISPTDDLTAAAAAQAVTQYAVSTRDPNLNCVIADMVDMIAELPREEWRNLQGPVLISQNEFDRLNTVCRARHKYLDILVDQTLVVRTSLGTGERGPMTITVYK